MGVLDVPFNRNVNVNNLENPFGTAEGQQAVSTSENFWARLARLGRVRAITKGATDFAASAGYGSYSTTYNMGGSAANKFPSLGHVFYPQCITISTTVDAEVWVACYQATQENSAIPVEQGGFIKANTPFTWYPDGSAIVQSGDYIGNDGTVIVRIGGPNAGKYRAHVTGIEIARGDV